jgi:hypothetical protein
MIDQSSLPEITGNFLANYCSLELCFLTISLRLSQKFPVLLFAMHAKKALSFNASAEFDNTELSLIFAHIVVGARVAFALSLFNTVCAVYLRD